MLCPDLVEVWVADGLPPLHRDGDDQEDAGREGEVTTALKEWEDELAEAVIKPKVERQDQKIGNEKKDISNTEAGEESVEKVELFSEKECNILKKM